MTPLIMAIKTQQIVEILKVLESPEYTNSNKINTDKDENGVPALHLAVKLADLSIIAALLEKNATIHVVDANQATPLHYAALLGNLDVLKYLIKKGAIPNALSRFGTPLFMAIAANHTAVMHHLITLLGHNNIELEDEIHPIHFAAQIGAIKSLKFLVENLAFDPRATNRMGATPLHLAASNGHFLSVQFLVEKSQAELYLEDVNHNTPLQCATHNNHHETAQYLSDVQFLIDFSNRVLENNDAYLEKFLKLIKDPRFLNFKTDDIICTASFNTTNDLIKDLQKTFKFSDMSKASENEANNFNTKIQFLIAMTYAFVAASKDPEKKGMILLELGEQMIKLGFEKSTTFTLELFEIFNSVPENTECYHKACFELVQICRNAAPEIQLVPGKSNFALSYEYASETGNSAESVMLRNCMSMIKPEFKELLQASSTSSNRQEKTPQNDETSNPAITYLKEALMKRDSERSTEHKASQTQPPESKVFNTFTKT